MRDAFFLPYLFIFFVFVINVHTRVNLRSYIRKIPSLVDFHSLYQLLYYQVYRNGLKHGVQYERTMFKTMKF